MTKLPDASTSEMHFAHVSTNSPTTAAVGADDICAPNWRIGWQ